MSRSLGIPVKLLHEASGHVVTVELKSGELYRGSMVECEDNWNFQLENITFTAKLCFLYLLMERYRNLSMCSSEAAKFMVIPDMLKNAPMFKKLDARVRGKSSSLGVGRGRAVAMRARASSPLLKLLDEVLHRAGELHLQFGGSRSSHQQLSGFGALDLKGKTLTSLGASIL
ncbi:hypothetical protein Taro_034983 [Colocasia esculenta]|uniref:Small nuclear ribonucleoprotein Sm D3 n=1 Tax=Colocasia esculenta TaxID=4460 RepID=A0A843WBS7_COLES|nr:hypothetical protein [Colocasia esculenta]